MVNISSDYIINFLTETAGIFVAVIDDDHNVEQYYGDKLLSEELLKFLKNSEPGDISKVQLNGKNFGVWYKRINNKAVFILKDEDDKAELENMVLDTLYQKDIDYFYKTLLHEIRTPLGTMRNYLFIVTEEMKKHGGGRRKTDVALDNLNAIHEETLRIDSLLDSIRGLGEEPEEERNYSDLALEVLFMEKVFRKVFEVKGVSFIVESPDEGYKISVPSRAVRQILSNLLTNACEASNERGRVCVVARDAKDHGVIEIRDSGGGIDEEKIPFLFKQPLVSKKGQGRGFGLWITGKIVEKYGGKIRYVNEKGDSVFIVEFSKEVGGAE